ncbi:MAG: hypothetical protein R6U13_16370 [Desulfatiglandaceae bacterium]
MLDQVYLVPLVYIVILIVILIVIVVVIVRCGQDRGRKPLPQFEVARRPIGAYKGTNTFLSTGSARENAHLCDYF